MGSPDPDTMAAPLSPPLSSPSLKAQPSPWHTGDRSFLTANVDELVDQLRRSEKVALLSGADWWHTVPVPRLNIPGVKMSDGPSGARGASFAEQTAGLAIPCETALAATFSPALVKAASGILAREAKDRGAVALLAPTTNIQRSPLGGRSFENFTEDPILSGVLATAYINGLQEGGVSAVLKHFVANDIEHERSAVSAEVSERALREVYLRPFQIAVKDANPLSIMSSYNRVNGVHVADSKEMLDGILHKEWAWDGMIMSDWFGTYSVDTAILAGQDIEMPGPGKWRTQFLIDSCINSRKLAERDLDKCVHRILTWAQRCARLSPDTVYGDDVELTVDRPADRALLEEIGARASVLLKNEGVLPLKTPKRIAVIGPRATDRTAFGGGSAQINMSYVVTVLEGVKAAAPAGTEVLHALGTVGHKMLPYLEMTRDDGAPGADMRLYAARGGEVVHHYRREASHVLLNDGVPAVLEGVDEFFGCLSGTWTADYSGEYQFSLAVCGRARLYVDDALVVDNWDVLQTPGDTFFGQGTEEEFGTMVVEKGRTYKIRCDYSSIAGTQAGSRDVGQQICNFGMRVGGFPILDAEDLMRQAEELAASADVVVVAVGLSPEWESESYDRPSLALPLRSDELVSRVAKANPKTIVAVQAGSAVGMPWVDEVAAVLHAWYGGCSSGASIASVLFGKTNPSARLPISFPKREEDIAAHGHFRSDNGKSIYAEDLSVGYKWFLERKIAPLFAFGHGLSYTQWKYGVHMRSESETELVFDVKISNVGDVAGAHSAVLYLASPRGNVRHPLRQLGGIASSRTLRPGESESREIRVTRRELSHWDDLNHCWTVQRGTWKAFLADDALAEEQHVQTFEVKRRYEWVGL